PAGPDPGPVGSAPESGRGAGRRRLPRRLPQGGCDQRPGAGNQSGRQGLPRRHRAARRPGSDPGRSGTLRHRAGRQRPGRATGCLCAGQSDPLGWLLLPLGYRLSGHPAGKLSRCCAPFAPSGAQIIGGWQDVVLPALHRAFPLRRIGAGLTRDRTGNVKRTLGVLLSALLGLWLLVGSCWASNAGAPEGYQSFVDTSGQLTLNDILSNRYANLFVPTAERPLKDPGAGAALWINVPLEHATTYLLELHNPSIARINVYLLQDDLLRVSHSSGIADPRASIPLPHGGFAFPINVTERDGKKLLVRLQNDYPMTTHL